MENDKVLLSSLLRRRLCVVQAGVTVEERERVQELASQRQVTVSELIRSLLWAEMEKLEEK